MHDAAAYLFTCPECSESATVNEPMMRAMLSDGCIICGCDLNEGAFEDVSA